MIKKEYEKGRYWPESGASLHDSERQAVLSSDYAAKPLMLGQVTERADALVNALLDDDNQYAGQSR